MCVYCSSLQEVQLDKHIKLLDSPGVIIAKGSMDDPALALRNCVKVRSEPVCARMLRVLVCLLWPSCTVSLKWRYLAFRVYTYMCTSILAVLYILYRYNTSVRGVACLQAWDPSAVGPRARVPINRNILSERCHNRFIFCCEVVQDVSLAHLGYQFFFHAFFPPFVTTSCHHYRNPHRSHQSVLGQCVCSLILRSQCGFVSKLTQLQQWLLVCSCSCLCCGCTLALWISL